MIKQLYTAYYTDGSYLSFNFTEDEYDAIGKHLLTDVSVKTEIGWINPRDIRLLVLARAQAPEADNPSAEPEMSAEEAEWIAAHKLGAKIMEEEDDTDDTDTDYEGGSI